MPAIRWTTCLVFGVLAILTSVSVLHAQELTGKVIDETGVVVAGVKVSLSKDGIAPLSAVSDEGGRFLIQSVPQGTYELRAEKPGYYATISRALQIGKPFAPLEVVLNHQQEFEETVNVVYSAPVVDRQEAAKTTTLTAEEITDLPSVATHDFKNSLPLIPGIVKDNRGAMHMNGGAENQIYYSLDGFNITSPVSGSLENRISVDAIRAVRIDTSRFSAEYGKGSAGVMALESAQGDNQFRFSATNFVPSVSAIGGLKLTNWNPRGTASGPIVKGRAWFYDALDLQYDLNVIKELPAGANTEHSWQGSNLTRIQLNITNKNIFTIGLLVNFRESSHDGISPLDPVETSRNLNERYYFINFKDQAYFDGGWVLETGIAVNRINNRENPLGTMPYRISPEGRSGNYFLRSRGRIKREQAIMSLLTPLWNWHGRHSFKFGIDANRIGYRQLSDRRTIEVLGTDEVLIRRIRFSGDPQLGRDSSEFSGYFQDSWTVNDHFFMEAGMRFDWDQVLRQQLWSPRFAFTWSPARLPDSKFSAGIGIFYDATDLRLLEQAQDQSRLDTFLSGAGIPGDGETVVTRFLAEDRTLKAPLYLNWSLGWQQKLRHGFYLDSNFMRKNGRRVWAYDLTSPFGLPTSQFDYRLGSNLRNSYTFVELRLSRTFKGKYPWLLSYARSSSRSTGVIDFSQDNPVFARQAGGPLDWDTPNRLISWGVFPLPRLKKYSLAYFAEWHSGMPWSQTNQYQRLVGEPNTQRFPDYFSLNLHAERRIHIFHSEWALRVGFNNLTSHSNPTVVNNNIDATGFGQFSGSPGRAFTGRIRFLGRN
jgi:hypothetical protein